MAAGIQTERSDRSSFKRIGRAAVKGESGQVIVLAALSMTILLGFLAFVTDVGLLLRQKRIIQTAADSAAIAGAAELPNGITAAKAAALVDSSQNGVTNGSGGVTITAGNPTSGPHAGSTSYVEVIISEPQQTFFMNAYHISSLTVKARAVAKAVSSNACLWAMKTAAGKGIDIGGTTQLSLNCGIVDNAAGSTALNVGGSAQLSAQYVDVAGTVTGSSNISNTTSVTTGMTPQSDPLASKVSPPSNPGGCTNLNVTSSQTIGPSSGGSICYSSLSFASGATATLNPGVYYINGSLTVSGGASLQGTGGVTFYITNGGSVSITGGATMNLTAPTSGSLSGILFYQDPADTQTFKFAGGSAGTINGIFYLPTAQLNLNGGSGQTMNVDLVVGNLNVTGNSFLNSYVPLTGASSLSDPVLTE